MVSDCLAQMLTSFCNVVGRASNGIEAVEMALRLRPNLIIMDIGLPLMGGVEATRRICSEWKDAVVIGLSMYCDQERITGLFDAGGKGFVAKESSYRELVEAMRCVAEGGTYVSPSLSRRAMECMAGRPRDCGAGSLTACEHKVACLLAGDLGSKDVSDALGISVSAVNTHKRSIVKKLDLPSQAELIRDGLVQAE